MGVRASGLVHTALRTAAGFLLDPHDDGRDRAHDPAWLDGVETVCGIGVRLVCAGVQMLFFSNALFHLITTFVFGAYSPGTASGAVLFLPLSMLLWWIVRREPGVTKGSFTTALVAGFVFHGLVLLNLLVDKSGWVAG